MTKDEIKAHALRLPERERLQLAEELWASVADPNDYPDDVPLLQWQKNLLDERLADMERNPDGGIPWEQVKKEIWPDAQ